MQNSAVVLESVAAQWRKAGDGAGCRRGCEVGNIRLDAAMARKGGGCGEVWLSVGVAPTSERGTRWRCVGERGLCRANGTGRVGESGLASHAGWGGE
jgi:hypothetical protein